MKLDSVQGTGVVKLGSGEGKVTGDPEEVRIARHVFHGMPLDS